MRPSPIFKRGRTRPYVTIVDTGLAVAIQNVLAGACLAHDEGTVGAFNWQRVHELSDLLSDEIERRTL